MPGLLRSAYQRALPLRARHWIRGRLTPPGEVPPPGTLRFGDLRRTAPLCPKYGLTRGLPIDRYYIERFLAAHTTDVRGRTLEVLDATYTRRYGGDRVTRSDVLNLVATEHATIVGDLVAEETLPADAFDCIILTQTLLLIFDLPAAVRAVHRALAPGGVLLVTVPGIQKIARSPTDEGWHDQWRFTDRSLRRLFEGVFPGDALEVGTYGNPLSTMASLYGMAVEELTPAELDPVDRDYQMIVTLRARKPLAAG